MPPKPTIRTLARRRDAIQACFTVDDICRLLGIRAERLLLLAENPQYREFQIPKKNGKMRHIEDPIPALKRVQDYLADFLQAVYYFHRTDAAYGFVIRPVDDPEPRHVLSNARCHLGKPWLMNLDMQDFFHTVTQGRVQEVLASPLLELDEEACRLLAALTTHKGRLPMGAPSSPVLSNLASIPLDHDLAALAHDQRWTYTRYADDMSFSSETPFAETAVSRIQQLVELWGYQLNPTKNKVFGPQSKDKAVTGLIVAGAQVALPDDYLPTLESAIAHLSKVVDAQFLTPKGRQQDTPWVQDIQQAISGKLEFARHILGEDHHWVTRLNGAYLDAIRPPEDYAALSWLEFGYDMF